MLPAESGQHIRSLKQIHLSSVQDANTGRILSCLNAIRLNSTTSSDKSLSLIGSDIGRKEKDLLNLT